MQLSMSPVLQLDCAASISREGTVSRPDPQAISALFKAHGPAVYRRALRLLGNEADAEEATQEIFVRVLRGADGFGERSKLSSWLYGITTNYCLNVLRDRRRRGKLHDEHVVTGAAIRGEAGDARSDDLSFLRDLLARGDEQQVQAAVYVYLDGMSHEQAAPLLGVSKRTVGNLLERFSAWARAQEAEPEASAPQRATGGSS